MSPPRLRGGGPAASASARRAAETMESERLAPYARRSADAVRRVPLDAEGRAFDYRTEFQRDRDRIIHSRAFRRLADKGRFHLAEQDDPLHSRQTHSLEVSQIARTLARALRLNEDLVEAIALGHDLGYPPFGSGGAEALGALLGGEARPEGLPPRGARDLRGFDVPGQSLRVVDLLEKRYDHPGLNLTDDVREGIWKQEDPCRGGSAGDAPLAGLQPGVPLSVEAQAVRVACLVAERTHALDDLLRARPDQLVRAERLALVRELLRRVEGRYRSASSLFMRLNVIHRGLTHLLVSAVTLQGERQLRSGAEQSKGSGAAGKRRGLPPDAVAPPPRVARMFEELAAFTEAERGSTRAAAVVRHRGRQRMENLFRAYHGEPELLDDYVLLRFREAETVRFLRDLPAAERGQEIARRYRGSPRLVRLICDHLAGMTDTYAEREHRRLCGAG